MILPEDFQFSQSSLQDFATCARRFELKYLRRMRWPAIEAEPVQEAERRRQLGLDFHRLVQQQVVGLDEAILTDSLAGRDAELKLWWQNYLAHRPALLAGATLYPELTLSTPFQGFRLSARFDLLAVSPDGTFWLIDWKTSQKKPERDKLAGRLQTKVYPFVLATAGAAYHGGQAIDPTAIKLMYWYPAAPDQPEVFDYNAALLKRDEQFLAELIGQIKQRAEQDHFPLVEDKQPCRHCVYRSFCDRGEQAGPLLPLEAEPEDELDVLALEWDQIAEIQF